MSKSKRELRHEKEAEARREKQRELAGKFAPEQQKLIFEAIRESNRIQSPSWRVPGQPETVTGEYIENVYEPEQRKAIKKVFNDLLVALGMEDADAIDERFQNGTVEDRKQIVELILAFRAIKDCANRGDL